MLLHFFSEQMTVLCPGPLERGTNPQKLLHISFTLFLHFCYQEENNLGRITKSENRKGYLTQDSQDDQSGQEKVPYLAMFSHDRYSEA